MDRPRRTVKWLALLVALLAVSFLLARWLVPFQPRTELKLPPGSAILACSPDGKTLYTATTREMYDGPICAWDLQTGRQRFSVASDWQGIMLVAVSADGRYLGASQKEHGIKIWDAQTGQEIHSLKTLKPTLWATDFRFSPDGELLLLQDYYGGDGDDIPVERVILWHLHDQRELGLLDDVWIRKLAESADGRRLAAWNLSDDGQARVRLWQVSTTAPPLLLADHHWCADAMAISPDLSCVATATSIGSEDSIELHLWDLLEGTKRDSLTLDCPLTPSSSVLPHSIVFSRDDLFIGLTDWRICRVTPRLREIGTLGAYPEHSPDGKLLAAALPNGAELFDAADLTRLGNLVNPRDEFLVPFAPLRQIVEEPLAAFSPDSRLVIIHDLQEKDDQGILSGWFNQLLGRETVGAMVTRMWDTASCREQLTLDYCLEVRFTPDGQTMLTRQEDDVLKLWDYPLRQPMLLMVLCTAGLWLLMATPIALARRARGKASAG